MPTYGSAEMLKRRYRPTPSSVKDEKAERARIVKRMRWSAYGIALCSLAILGTVYFSPDLKQEKSGQKEQFPTGRVTVLDAPPATTGIAGVKEVEQQVPTGISAVPTFPQTIHVSTPSSAPAGAKDGGDNVEYQLVGFGVRTVSFLGIQVYVVGLYIAIPDIATIQQQLVHVVADPVATTLVPGEKAKLKDLLLDPEQGEDIWNQILKDGGVRMAFRIVPTRNTDFMHLRDSFVRNVTARSAHFAKEKGDPSFSDDTFGRTVNDFKVAFGGGATKKLPKGETLLLARDGQGRLALWYEDKKSNRVKMGAVEDERLARLLWLNYLAGKTVSSEPARQSVIEGLMEYVGRPVGTIERSVL